MHQVTRTVATLCQHNVARQPRCDDPCVTVHRQSLSPSLHLCVGYLQLKCVYKACSKKDWTFAIKTLFFNILSTVPFKVVPFTGNTPFPTFLPLLECFLDNTFLDDAQFSYRIFLNLRVFKKRPNFLNCAPTSTEGALRLLSAPSGRFWQQLIRRTACARPQFSGCSSTNNAHSEMGQMAVCCQNLSLDAFSSHSATSLVVGALF
jgi:hypothetical protein